MTDSTLPANATTTQEGTDPKDGKPPVKTEKPENGKAFDPSQIDDESFEKVFSDPRLFKHKRFEQLNQRAKLADQLEKDKQEAEEAQLKKQGKIQELLTKREEELANLKQQLSSQKVDGIVQAEAIKAGVVDVDAVQKLLDKSRITTSDTGEVSGVAEAIKSLITEKPYLAGKPATTTLGQGSAPGGDGQNAPMKFKASQLQDVNFFREHEKEIDVAMRSGLIEDDLPAA